MVSFFFFNCVTKIDSENRQLKAIFFSIFLVHSRCSWEVRKRRKRTGDKAALLHLPVLGFPPSRADRARWGSRNVLRDLRWTK